MYVCYFANKKDFKEIYWDKIIWYKSLRHEWKHGCKHERIHECKHERIHECEHEWRQPENL